MEEHSRGQRSERTPWKLKGQVGYTNTALFHRPDIQRLHSWKVLWSHHTKTCQMETSRCPSTWTRRPILKHSGAIMSWDRWNYIQGEAELQQWSHVLDWPSQSPDLNPAESLRRDLQTLHPVWLHWSYFMLQSVDEAGDTSPQTVPAVDVLGLNTNARHTFNFSSSLQWCAALCWSQIKANQMHLNLWL